MPKYTVALERSISLSKEIVVDAPGAREAAQSAYAIGHQLGYRVEAVVGITAAGTEGDLILVTGFCESCERVIFEIDEYAVDREDCVYTCKECLASLNADSQ